MMTRTGTKRMTIVMVMIMTMKMKDTSASVDDLARCDNRGEDDED